MLPEANVGASSGNEKELAQEEQVEQALGRLRPDLGDAARGRRPGEIDHDTEEDHVGELQTERSRGPQVHQKFASQHGIIAEDHVFAVALLS